MLNLDSANNILIRLNKEQNVVGSKNLKQKH